MDDILQYAGLKYYDKDLLYKFNFYPINKYPITMFMNDVFESHKYEIWESRLGIPTQNSLIFGFYESYDLCIRKIEKLDIKYTDHNITNIKYLFCAEDTGFHIDNSFLEYICGFRMIEEIVISDTEHYVTRLPSFYLHNLRGLFICNDRNVTITDKDLSYMPNLEYIELSHNTSITETGLSQCKKLKDIELHAQNIYVSI